MSAWVCLCVVKFWWQYIISKHQKVKENCQKSLHSIILHRIYSLYLGKVQIKISRYIYSSAKYLYLGEHLIQIIFFDENLLTSWFIQSLLICKKTCIYASMQVCMNIVGMYAGFQIHKLCNIQLCWYTYWYFGMQICNFGSMQVCRHADTLTFFNFWVGGPFSAWILVRRVCQTFKTL